MSVNRLKGIPGFSIDQVARDAGNDPDVLRMENLDTDLDPPFSAIIATKSAIGADKDNSYLPFIGRDELRTLVADRINRTIFKEIYESKNIVITCGATEAMLDTLLATTDPGDEVIMTDPTYAGMIQRVRLVGATPTLVPFYTFMDTWRLDIERLQLAVNDNTRVLFLMNPSMPSGAVLNAMEWGVIAKICIERKIYLIYNAAMERILFDGQSVFHPASIPGMEDLTITIGSMSKEYRMIGWRVGWIAAPKHLINDIARVHIYNTVTATGIAQSGAIAALSDEEDGFGSCLAEWERRRDMINTQLKDFPMVSAAGGWSQLLDVGQMGYDGATASKLLLEKGKVAATPMIHWGDKNSEQFVRLVFSNEPVKRLSTLRNRVKQAFG